MELTFDQLVGKVLELEKTVKKITALPQMSKLAGRDAEIMNSRVKGTKYECLASPAVTLTTDDNSAEAIQNTLENSMGNTLDELSKRGALPKL